MYSHFFNKRCIISKMLLIKFLKSVKSYRMILGHALDILPFHVIAGLPGFLHG